ncbi:MAG TPA: PEP-CTERM sorting domain-containing protein [Pyrinomonadaceae bacterium]
MNKLSKVISCITLVFLLLAASEARADTVEITSGFVSIGGVYPPGRGTFRTINFSLAGDNFTFNGTEVDGTTQQVTTCTFGPCPAGTLINSSSVVRLQGVGSATINGLFYPITQPLGSLLTFTGESISIPSSGEPVIFITTPFTMTGTLNVVVPPGTSVFSATAVGSGFATLTLRQFESGYVLTTIRYDFQRPIPEPSTIILLCTGLAGVVRVTRRRRSKI